MQLNIAFKILPLTSFRLLLNCKPGGTDGMTETAFRATVKRSFGERERRKD